MPGVLIIEAMAQTAAVIVVAALQASMPRASSFTSWRSTAPASAVPVEPGDQLKLHCRKERQRGNVWKFSAEESPRRRHVVVAEATYTAMIMDT